VRRLPRKRWLATRARLSVSPTRIVTLLLRWHGVTTMKQLRRHPEGVDLGPLRPTMPERLRTEDHRIDLAPALLVADLPRLQAWVDAQLAGPDDGLLLIGRRHQRDNNAWFHNIERVTRGRRRHQLLMHPDDLSARGIADGAQVRVTSRVGEVTVDVQASDDMMPGVVSLPHGYGHQVPGTRLEHAATVPGVSINDLTDPEALDVSGNAALSGVPVTVAPA
jgi:anaerobic selenocysteine-containing dehydrogenase